MFGPRKHTQAPIVTGTSVLAVKYVGGVLLASDCLGSYGSMAMFTNITRFHKVSDSVIVGASGDYSDFQYIRDQLDALTREYRLRDDGVELTASEVHNYLSRVLYNRRNKMDPLWNSLVVAGVAGGVSTVGVVDLIGTTYSDNFITTGYGTHLALPLIRDRWTPDMTEGEARVLLEDCMRVLYYRDCRALNKIQLAKVDATGAVVSEPFLLDTKWDYEGFVRPKAGADTDGSW